MWVRCLFNPVELGVACVTLAVPVSDALILQCSSGSVWLLCSRSVFVVPMVLRYVLLCGSLFLLFYAPNLRFSDPLILIRCLSRSMF